MTTRIRTGALRASLMAAVMFATFALLPAPPALAGQFLGVMEGTVTLNSGTLACGSGTFEGTASGLHAGEPINQGRLTASFTYCSDLATGTANGSLNLAGHHCVFSWTRTGTTAVMTISGTDCDTPGTAYCQFSPAGSVGLGCHGIYPTLRGLTP